jgi:hypothetical protein
VCVSACSPESCPVQAPELGTGLSISPLAFHGQVGAGTKPAYEIGAWVGSTEMGAPASHKRTSVLQECRWVQKNGAAVGLGDGRATPRSSRQAHSPGHGVGGSDGRVLCLATLLERIESTEHHLREQRLPTFSNATAFLPDAGPSLLKKSNLPYRETPIGETR